MAVILLAMSSREDFEWNFRSDNDSVDDSPHPLDQGTDLIENNPPSGTLKKITWTYDLLMLLVSMTKKHNGHLTEKKTKHVTRVTQEQKWERIAYDLKGMRAFKYYELKSVALKKKFDKLKSEIAQRANIDNEGNNVSGYAPPDALMAKKETRH